VLDAVYRKIAAGTEYRIGGNRRSVLSSDDLFMQQLPASTPEWTDHDREIFESLGAEAIEEATR